VKDVASQKDDKTGSDATPTKEAPQMQEDNTQLLREQEEKRNKLREERNEISRQVILLFWNICLHQKVTIIL